jgi:teichuronic acid biosynthesis glycosyltransferase TuaC
MNILFVCSGNNRDGISPIVKSQGECLIRAGVQLSYFPVAGKGILGYANAIGKLKKRLRKTPVDLLHAHYGLCGWVAHLAKPKRVPLILSYMGSDILPQTWMAGFNRLLQNKADHVIVKSKNLADLLKRKDGVSLIPNGVDLELFVPMAKEESRKILGLDAIGPIVLFLGDLRDKNKNIQLLEKAIKTIPASNIILLAPYPIPSAQVPVYLNAADALVLSSLFEGSPNVIKEAMACNCPIVATDVGDVRWVIGDTPGCFISGFSPEEMALKLKNAIAFKNRTAGRERIRQLELDVASASRKIVAIYQSLLH